MKTREVYVLKLKNITYNSAVYISPCFTFGIKKKANRVNFNIFGTESYSLILKSDFCNKDDALWFIGEYKNAILDFISNYNALHLDQLGNEITLVKFTFTIEKEELDTFKLED